ncbi:uroporphyrinogen-III synthase [Leekyejoonella antrihumi]|nr:uroporphyrinogen-III synthase [Leekyejoonella antrihumi]
MAELGDLSGRRIVLTAQRSATEMAAALERRGARVVHAQTMSMISHADDADLAERTDQLIARPPDVLVATTGIGLRGWFEAADARGAGTALYEALSGAYVIARGAKAQGALQARGITPDWVAPSETMDEIRTRLLSEGVEGKWVAVQHHGIRSDDFDAALRDGGAQVCAVTVYRSGPAPDPEAVRSAAHLVARRECDAVLFTAAPGVVAFLDVCRAEGVLAEVTAAFTAPDGVLAAAVGDTAAAPLRAGGIAPLVPKRFRSGALIRAVVEELSEHRRPRSKAAPVLVVCAHGTADADGRRTVLDIAAAVRRARPGLQVEVAYVDVQDPAVAPLVDRLVGEGNPVVVVPLLLSTGYHTQVDVARAVESRVRATAARPLGPAPELAEVLRDRLLESGAGRRTPVVLAAAGSSRTEAADDVDAQAEHLRELWDGEVRVGYLAGEPSVADVVKAHPGAAVATYLIGRGFFQTRLERVDATPIAEPLGAHPRLIDLVLRRFDEVTVTQPS